jgi:hypothetical protein
MKIHTYSAPICTHLTFLLHYKVLLVTTASPAGLPVSPYRVYVLARNHGSSLVYNLSSMYCLIRSLPFMCPISPLPSMVSAARYPQGPASPSRCKTSGRCSTSSVGCTTSPSKFLHHHLGVQCTYSLSCSLSCLSYLLSSFFSSPSCSLSCKLIARHYQSSLFYSL